MGQHIDQRGFKKKTLKERDNLDRRNRASFKQYLRALEEDLEEDLLKEDLKQSPLDDLQDGTDEV